MSAPKIPPSFAITITVQPVTELKNALPDVAAAELGTVRQMVGPRLIRLRTNFNFIQDMEADQFQDFGA